MKRSTVAALALLAATLGSVDASAANRRDDNRHQGGGWNQGSGGAGHGGHHGGGNYGHHSGWHRGHNDGWHSSFYFGAAYPGWGAGYWGPGVGLAWGDAGWVAPYYGYGVAYPYAYPYRVYPRYPVAQIPVYEQEAPATVYEPPPGAVATSTLWFYCTDPAGYHPYVKSCNTTWIEVEPQTTGDASGAPRVAR